MFKFRGKSCLTINEYRRRFLESINIDVIIAKDIEVERNRELRKKTKEFHVNNKQT